MSENKERGILDLQNYLSFESLKQIGCYITYIDITMRALILEKNFIVNLQDVFKGISTQEMVDYYKDTMIGICNVTKHSMFFKSWFEIMGHSFA